MAETIGQRWLRQNAHRLNYDPKDLPDVGDLVGERMVSQVDRLEGWYALEDGERVTLPRLSR